MEEKLCPSCEEPVIDKFPPCPLQCMSTKCKAYQKPLIVNTSHKPVIWILGGPGSGKGTQCNKINAKFGYKHLSVGDLLREEVDKDTHRSTCIRNVMKRGVLVPNDIVLDILKEKMKELESKVTGFLIDGYPRNKTQGMDFEKTICEPNLIIFFQISPATMAARLQKLASQSPRYDDSKDAIPRRIATFMESKDDILEQFADSGRFVVIDAEKAEDVIFSNVLKCLEPIAKTTKSALDAAIAAASIPKPLPPVPETAKAAMAKKSTK